MPRSVPLIRGLREIAPDYDALVVDLWGVIHGGVEPYPDVLETLAAVRAARLPIGLLSNAPRRSHMVARRLAEIGVPANAYDGLMTSGEAAHDALAARSDVHAELGRNYLYVGPHWDTDLAEGLDYRRVDRVEEADFLLTVGLFDEADPLSSYDDLFAGARKRDLVMLCVNPDLVVHRQSGATSPCAGLLAHRYEGQGGRVIYHGKPDPAVFHRCAEGLGAGSADARVLVVGDSLTTDVKGAVAAGYDSLWVTRGIYAAELGIAPGDEPEPEKIVEVCERHGHWPTAAIAAFRW
jgi:HAD superfamily hydrolase (TIGR01459 family)